MNGSAVGTGILACTGERSSPVCAGDLLSRGEVHGWPYAGIRSALHCAPAQRVAGTDKDACPHLGCRPRFRAARRAEARRQPESLRHLLALPHHQRTDILSLT